MQSEPHVLMSTPGATVVRERKRTERLSLRAAIFWMGVLSLGGWVMIVALVLALD